MREILQLPVDHDQPVDSSAKDNEAKSWLFSGGLLVGIVAGLLGFALASYANSLASESTVDQQIEFGRSQLDDFPPAHLWEAWDSMTKAGPPDWAETRAVRYNKQSRHLKSIAYGLYAVSAIGLVAMAISFFVRRS